MRVHLVDPPAFTPPYDHALASALARAGADVQLITSRFAYGAVPDPDGYVRRELFYRRAAGAAGSRTRRLSKLVSHGPEMLRYRRVARDADVVHFQWLTTPVLDVHLLPRRPLVLTAHDLLPREPRPGQLAAHRRLLERVDAVVVHSEYGRGQLVDGLGLDPERVHVIHHGAFAHAASRARAPLPRELSSGGGGAGGRPVVLFAGLLRPYKGLDTLLRAWRRVTGAELWIVGRPMMDLAPLQSLGGDGVRWVPRFVSDGELAALLDRADIVVLPYARTQRFDQSGVLATALAFGKAVVVTDIGGFSEIADAGAARLVAPDDPDALGGALADLVADPAARERLAAAALAAGRAGGPLSWEAAAEATLALYARVTG
ncbi:MAG TPA: glycosyltransferase family 4 protein [Solirubrobacteraceae bacterium]|jgi:glycosyltransferase involved in cell wall biosynthesis|nr:glycosyltransferase family 4 protein [Solirubrobacteraceae bacterium]